MKGFESWGFCFNPIECGVVASSWYLQWKLKVDSLVLANYEFYKLLWNYNSLDMPDIPFQYSLSNWCLVMFITGIYFWCFVMFIACFWYLAHSGFLVFILRRKLIYFVQLLIILQSVWCKLKGKMGNSKHSPCSLKGSNWPSATKVHCACKDTPILTDFTRITTLMHQLLTKKYSV